MVGAHWAANCAFLRRGCIVTSTVQMNKILPYKTK